MAEINGYIPKELKRKFKTVCAAADRSMSDVLIELIEGWIEEQEAQNNPPAKKGKGIEDDSDD
ncbi:MAG: ParG [Symplocastrum torsivum CPER-KK1]|uniref:ParG n=1 Tax=Symplocastrum torsivum CPER-KK1 TaxID=450513 RepID=A0A951PRK7_9CYAN|nr:ParG [Symplocastrum torsivum CPER-KK1]